MRNELACVGSRTIVESGGGAWQMGGNFNRVSLRLAGIAILRRLSDE